MFDNFPYTDFHQLNLDWIIKIAKDFLDQYTNIQQTITDGLDALEEKKDTLEALLDEWYATHSEDIANELADAIAAFNAEAQAKGIEVIASIPEDYTDFYNTAVKSKLSVVDVFPNLSTYDMNDFPIDSIIDVNTATIASVTNRPSNFTSGFETITANSRYPSTTGMFQISISYDGQMAYRIKTTSWGAWQYVTRPGDLDTLLASIKSGIALTAHFSVTDEFPNASTYDFNNFPINSIIDVPTSLMAVSSNKPGHFQSGCEVMTINSRYPSYTGCIQIAVGFDKRFAYRYRTTSWSGWIYLYDETVIHTYHCQASGGDFSDIAFGLKFLNQHFGDWNEHNRAVIEVDEGIFSLGNVVTYIGDGDIEERGLYIPPYCSINGKGKDKTIIRFLYTGSDSTFMFNVSGLNMPYESELSNLTLEVQNLRYAIHSDGGMGWYKSGETTVQVNNNTELLNNCKQRLYNVKLLHKGFEDGKTPIDPVSGTTYKTPACWGSGSWNNCIEEFDSCDFISLQVAPWFNHNRDDLTDASTFIFNDCTFINGTINNPQLNLSYASIGLISWGSGIRNPVYIKNCMCNHAIALYNTGTATCDYYVYCDNEIEIIESSVNNAQLLNNFYSGYCKTGLASLDIRAYTPMSKEFRRNLVKYNPSLPFAGISLNSAATNEQINYLTDGWIYIPSLTTNSDLYLIGKELGYDNANNQWVEDTTDPIIRVINYQAGILLK